MATSPPTRNGPRTKPVENRRTTPGTQDKPGPLRWVKGVLGRELGLERRGSQLHVVLIDRRRAPSVAQPPSISQLCAELRARLLAHERDHAAQAMRHLVLVHDELGRKGWSGVEALPGQVMNKALVEAEMLTGQESSPFLAVIIERLRVLKAGADMREDRKAHLRDLEKGEALEVSEATHEEFEEIERSWVGTLPAEVVLPDRDK